MSIQLKATRESLKISVDELAKEVGMEPFWLKRFEETGNIGLLPAPGTFERICMVIGQKSKFAYINTQDKLDLLKKSLSSL